MSEEKQGVQGSLNRATGAGGTINLGGKVLKAKALQMSDYGVAEAHLRAMQKSPIDAVKGEIVKLKRDAFQLKQEAAKLRDPKDADRRTSLQEEAAVFEQMAESLLDGARKDLRKDKELAKLDLGTVLDWLYTDYEGLIFFTWLSIRDEYKEWDDLDKIRAQIAEDNQEARDATLNSIRINSGIDDEGNSTGPATTSPSTGPESLSASQLEAAKTT